MLVVLDSNAFHSDVHGARPQLRGILDAPLSQAAFELFVPEVVLRELDKQFAQRSKKVVREMNKAFGEFNNELVKLGMQPLASKEADSDAVQQYRPSLEERLSGAGASILPFPEDLSPAIDWAVKRRKPFKESGEGFQDAVIWLSVLELAGDAKRKPILLVSSNWKDFAETGSKSELADVLKDDLQSRGCPRSQVRLVPGIAAFADEVAEKASIEVARGLASAGAFNGAIEGAVLFSRLDREVLGLEVPLDSDPQVTALDLERVKVGSAAELPGGDLLVHASVEVELEMDLLIDRADYYGLTERAMGRISAVNANFNEQYVQAETSATLRLELTINSSPDGSNPQVHLDGFSLAPAELVVRALHGRAREELVDEISASLAGHSVENYIADEPIESDIDEATVNAATRIDSIRFVEVVEEDEESYSAALHARAEADVEWASNAPTPFDADRFASLALNVSSDAPILQDFDMAVPLEIRLTARYDDEHGWHEVELDQVVLDEDERERRSSRPSAAETFMYELDDEDPT